MTTDMQNIARKKRSLPAYLVELTSLADRQVNEEELTTLERTNEVRLELSRFADADPIAFTIPFSDLTTDKFKLFVSALSTANPSAVFLWTPRANDCGLLSLPSITKVQFSFPFELIPEGILVVSTVDCSDRLTLDFCENELGERLVEVELLGKHWANKSCDTGMIDLA